MIILPKLDIPFDTIEGLVENEDFLPTMGGGGMLEQKARVRQDIITMMGESMIWNPNSYFLFSNQMD